MRGPGLAYKNPSKQRKPKCLECGEPCKTEQPFCCTQCQRDYDRKQDSKELEKYKESLRKRKR